MKRASLLALFAALLPAFLIASASDAAPKKKKETKKPAATAPVKKAEPAKKEEPAPTPTPTPEPTPTPTPTPAAETPKPAAEAPKETVISTDDAPVGHLAMLDVALGMGILSRHLSYSEQVANLPNYDLGVAPEVALSAEFYPMAKSSGFGSKIGLIGSFGYAFGINSSYKSAPDTKFGTSAYRFGIGPRVRFPFGYSEIGVSVEYANQTFAVDMPLQAATGRQNVPKVSYGMVRPALSARLALSDSVSAMAGVGYLLVLSAADMRSNDWWSSSESSVWGFDANLGLGFEVASGIEIRVLGDLRRFAWKMTPAPANVFQVSGASDMFIGATAMIAYRK
jgi:hypothetical protein